MMTRIFPRTLKAAGCTCLLCLSLASCSDEEEIVPPAPVSFTTLVYMAADNSLDSEVDYSIAQLKEGARRSAGTAVVYVDRLNASPSLFKITQQGEIVPLREYGEENSACTETLVRVISETKQLVPAERFGLVLWSHSMGWLPIGYSTDTYSASRLSGRTFPHTRYIGLDQHPGNGSGFTMEIDALADDLPDHVAEYIWFDVCLMGSVEALYELRNKSRYLIASPSEVLAEAAHDASGIPYAEVLPYLFGGEEELRQACHAYFGHYSRMGQEILRSATITLVDADRLDALYNAVRTVLRGRLRDMGRLDTQGLQVYHTGNVPQVFFDMRDVLQRLEGQADATIEARLQHAVIYKAATEKIIKEVEVDPEKFSGLSMYVPLDRWKDNYEYGYYFGSLEWAGVYAEEGFTEESRQRL